MVVRALGRRALVALLVLIACGCTRVIDSPRPRPEPPVAPITAGQVGDLLSDDARKGDDGNLFVTVEPERCAGVAREVEAPFVFDSRPAAHDGGHWDTDVGRRVYVEEIVGVYHANFNPSDALTKVRDTVESCRDTPLSVTAMDKDEINFRLVPTTDSGSQDIVLWSFEAGTWACDNAFVAAHNAAVEITTCSETRGYDVLALAKAARQRIEALAKTTM